MASVLQFHVFRGFPVGVYFRIFSWTAWFGHEGPLRFSSSYSLYHTPKFIHLGINNGFSFLHSISFIWTQCPALGSSHYFVLQVSPIVQLYGQLLPINVSFFQLPWYFGHVGRLPPVPGWHLFPSTLKFLNTFLEVQFHMFVVTPLFQQSSHSKISTS